MKTPRMVYLALTAQTLISATTYLIAKSVLGVFDPLELALLRFGSAAIVFVAMLWRLPPPRVPPKEALLACVLLGAIGAPLNQGFFLEGLARTSPNHAALMYAITPLAVFALSAGKRLEKASRFKLAGIAVALGGVVLVLFERGLEGQILVGDALIFVAMIAWASYTVFGKAFGGTYGPLRATAWTLIAGGLVSFPFAPLVMTPAHLAHAPVQAWLSVAYLGVMTSVVSYLLWYYALARTEPSRVAVFSNLQPVATALLAWAVQGVPITPLLAGGGALVIFGVLLTQRG